MTLKNALCLHNEDEVTVKKTGQIMTVIQVKYIPKDPSYGRIKDELSVFLEDGCWYDHKELK
jgi:hypothetical protein